jgi:ribose-phosphate pyrophosphokinase
MTLGGFERGALESKIFADGERYHRIDSHVEGRDVVIIGGTINDADTLEIYDLACAFSKLGALSLTLVMPYYGYSTMERAVKPGEVVTAKTRARLFSAVPPAIHGNRALLLDLHAEGIPHYFEGGISAKHVYAKDPIKQAIRQFAEKDFVLASTDAGRAKWVQSLAIDLDVPASFVLKQRTADDATELMAVSAHVEGQNVVIYDDMIRTGGSLITAAKAYKDAGAKSIMAVATHGILPGDSLAKLQKSGLFSKVVCTNSHPSAVGLAGDFLHVVSVAETLVLAINAGFRL